MNQPCDGSYIGGEESVFTDRSRGRGEVEKKMTRLVTGQSYRWAQPKISQKRDLRATPADSTFVE